MKADTTDLVNIYLKPGHMYISERPTLISTILGSCVSVTMFSPRLRIGAICHGLLPVCKHEGLRDNSSPEGFKYVDYSIETMVHAFEAYGITPREIEVKLFGGSDVLTSMVSGSGITIGGMNIEAALRTIRANNLNMVSSDVGGCSGRKIYFSTHTGEVLLRHLAKMKNKSFFNHALQQDKRISLMRTK